ncbi:MAG: hypothetical protein WAQ25_04525 [Candidatus Saccharimonas sp.]
MTDEKLSTIEDPGERAAARQEIIGRLPGSTEAALARAAANLGSLEGVITEVPGVTESNYRDPNIAAAEVAKAVAQTGAPVFPGDIPKNT